MSSPHAQTVASFLVAPRAPLSAETWRVPLERGALGGLITFARRSSPRGAVLLLHGAAGTGLEPYLVRTAHKLARAGFDAIRLGMRGSGGATGVVPDVLHGGLTEDVRRAVARATERYAQVALIGFSLGGQIALRTAAEWGPSPPPRLKAVVAISPALDLLRSTEFFDRPGNWLYRRVVMGQLHKSYLRIRRTLPGELQKLGPDSFKYAGAYNADLVAPAFGFLDAPDYYERSSAIKLLHAVNVPSLLLHAEDDPVVPVGPAYRAQEMRPGNVRVVITRHGGHVGFFAGAASSGDEDRFWAESRAVRFIEEAAA